MPASGCDCGAPNAVSPGFAIADLQDRVSLELDRVRAVVDHRGEAVVDVRDVEALEVVVDVQRPVRVHDVVARADRIEHELVERQVTEPLAHRGDDVVERHRRRERDHQEALPRSERDARQIVGR